VLKQKTPSRKGVFPVTHSLLLYPFECDALLVTLAEGEIEPYAGHAIHGCRCIEIAHVNRSKADFRDELLGCFSVIIIYTTPGWPN
jgi:hypothetical protein